MTGVVAAVAGSSGPNVLWSAGLYNTSTGVDASPIGASGSSTNGSTNINYTWIGYYRPNVTGAVAISLQSVYTEYLDVIPNFGSPTTYPYNWSGAGNSVGYAWIGSTAVSGYSAGNANISASTNTSPSVNVSLYAGLYYPIRINWTSSLPYLYDSNTGDDYKYYATSSIGLTIGGTSSISGLIFYNGRTNGF